METIRKMDLFSESQPRMCVWCRYCAAVYVDDGEPWGYVCLLHHDEASSRVKNAIRPFPVNTGNRRTRVQCVNADEAHDCFKPTTGGDPRVMLLDRLGILGDWRKAVLWNDYPPHSR